CTSPQSYSSLSEGSHTFRVRAIDSAANTDPTPASFTWTVDTIAPTVTIEDLSIHLLGVGQSAQLHWHANENGSFVLRLGGSSCPPGPLLDSGPYTDQPASHTSTIPAAALAEGSNTLRLCLTDAAQNTGSASDSLSKDSTAPDTQIDSHPADPTASQAAAFTFSGDD